MSSMRKEKVEAILLSDLHLSFKAPKWRSVEPYWFGAMKRPLDEVRLLQSKYQCPVIGAGDIFNRWFANDSKGAPELINFALEFLPDMIAIPGQHDLPLHNYNDIKKSAYWTLVQAGKITNLLPFTHKDFSLTINNIILYGFPFGSPIQPLVRKANTLGKIHVAVVHQYVWIDEHSFPKALRKDKIKGKRKEWKGYDAIVYGDNHKGFAVNYNGPLSI